MVFTTEGHMIQLENSPKPNRRRKTLTKTPPTCPIYNLNLNPKNSSSNSIQNELQTGIKFRKDFEYARFAAGFNVKNEIEEVESGRWSKDGFCSIPIMEVSFNFISSFFF